MLKLLRSLTVMLAGLVALSAHAVVELEGVQLEDTVTVAGTRLVLNGAGVRKRGYFKTDVTALYLPERRTNVEAIYKPNGVRRLVLVLLRDIPSSTISRYFVGDFKQIATDAEFKQVINEVGQMGQVYGGLAKVSKGDTVIIDWIPGTGLTAALNGKPMTDKTFKNELFYEIYMRMYLGASVPEDFRNALLGVSKPAH
jgi:hypothetical protein